MVSAEARVTDMLWGSRFVRGPHADMMRLTSSFQVDIRLLDQDVAVTAAHARALGRAGLLDDGQVADIEKACGEILERWRTGTLQTDPDDEDIHSLVERLLTERLGDTGSRVHAGRSRNDLVATDLKLWCKASTEHLMSLLASLIEKLAARAEEHDETVMPGYTHLQRAQPVSLGFHLVAHSCSLERDARRFTTAFELSDVSSLGAGALAGTTLDLDPLETARDLGFSAAFVNAMQATSDRDFVADLAYACALTCVHLSRLAEEIVLWTSAEFRFASLPDEWSTGSSMMPQKRNPDLAELVRGRAAGGVADLVGLLALMKSLPLAYGRDLQEDKGFAFATVDRTAACIEGMSHLTQALVFDPARMAEAAATGAAWATDLAEALVARGVPFREAHEVTGRLVADLESKGSELSAASEATLKAHHAAFEAADVELADPHRSMRVRSGPGGTAPERVREQIEYLRGAVGRIRERIVAD